MKTPNGGTHAHAARLISVTGKLPALSSKNLKRIAVFLTQGNKIISEAAVSAGGTFQFHITPQLAGDQSVSAVLGPQGLDSQSLESHADLPSIVLTSGGRTNTGGINIDFGVLNINDKLIEPWWIWCREYTVSGTLLTAAGCPIGAEVTVYNVTSGVTGLVKTPIATVPTNSDGSFTASFNWCSERFCWWPCWPVWWRCWPWWWELDILAVIENIESRLAVQSPGVSRLAAANVAPLRQPLAADLMTGVGLAGSRAAAELKQDSARTALIASKFADQRIREIFPWWWWCCQNPNIVFSASQGSTIILDEDPNTSTRWCFASGQTVTLTGNSQSLGACPVNTGGDCGFAWTSVGSEPPNAVLVDDISMGYAIGSGACANLAFAGSLNLNGVFSSDCTAFYQVLGAQWDGDPARGGSLVGSFTPIAENLYNWVTIWRDALGAPMQYKVKLGPFTFNSLDNLYTTLPQRQSATTPAAVLAQIGAFPALGPGDFIMGWAWPDLVLTVPAGDLISPATTAGASLSVAPYDVTGAPIPSADFKLGPELTLMIDTTPVSAVIDWVHVYNADGSPAIQTAASSTVCPAYQVTPGGYALIHTTVVDNAGHLGEYYIQTQYGDGLYAAANPSDRDYAQAPATFTPHSLVQPYGVDAGYATPNAAPPPPPAPQTPGANDWMFTGGGDITQVFIPQSCCYDFQLWVSKRTTDGETFACSFGNPAFQTVNIVVAS